MISSILKTEIAVELVSAFAYLEVEGTMNLTKVLYYWQGLSPMMFMFALVGNLTYVGR